MSVYEATTKADFQKVVRFLQRQPRGSLSLRCWKVRFSQVTESFLRQMKQRNLRLKMFYIQDGKGRVRAVFSYEQRGPDFNPKEPKIVTFAFTCIDHEDVAVNNRAYYNRLVTFLIKEYGVKKGFTKGEFWGTEEKALWSRELFGTALKITRQVDHPEFGKLFRYTIDFTAYLEGLRK